MGSKTGTEGRPMVSWAITGAALQWSREKLTSADDLADAVLPTVHTALEAGRVAKPGIPARRTVSSFALPLTASLSHVPGNLDTVFSPGRQLLVAPGRARFPAHRPVEDGVNTLLLPRPLQHRRAEEDFSNGRLPAGPTRDSFRLLSRLRLPQILELASSTQDIGAKSNPSYSREMD